MQFSEANNEGKLSSSRLETARKRSYKNQGIYYHRSSGSRIQSTMVTKHKGNQRIYTLTPLYSPFLPTYCYLLFAEPKPDGADLVDTSHRCRQSSEEQRRMERVESEFRGVHRR